MDGWEWTKVGSAVTLAVGVAASGGWFAGQVVSPEYPQRRGYALEGIPPVDLASVQRGWPGGPGGPRERDQLIGYIKEIHKAVVPAPAAGPAVAAAPVDLGTLLAAADADRGKRTAQVCASCHTFEQGGPNRVGPNLYAVVGRRFAGHAGFAYSPALAGAGGQWSYQDLDRFLTSPGRAIPGTKMAFNGIRNPRDRANLLAYLAALTPGAPPFPAPQPPAQAAAPAAEAPAAP